MLFLQILIVLAAYFSIKCICIAVNESEAIQFIIPKLIERASLGGMAFSSQLILF